MPNFTAADILRLTGIGRNQYISLLHQTHPRSSLSRKLFGRAALIHKLPHGVKRIPLEDDWLVHPGYPTEAEADNLTLKSKWTLDKLIKAPIRTVDIDKRCLYELMNVAAAFIEVPVEPNEQYRVKMLDGFVMNRLGGDHIESALYKVNNFPLSTKPNTPSVLRCLTHSRRQFRSGSWPKCSTCMLNWFFSQWQH